MRNTEIRRTRLGRLSIVMLCCTAVFLGGCSERRSKQQSELGDTYLRLGKTDQAMTAYEKSLELNPENVEAVLGRARCLRANNRPDEAQEAYKRAIEIRPTSDPAYVEAARMLAMLNRLEEAEQWAADYEKVTHEHGTILQAYILRNSGRADEAVALLEALRKGAPRSAEVRLSLASAYMAANRVPQAEQELKSILEELDPSALSARMALVDVYRRQGRLKEIIEQFRTLSEQHPDDIGVKLALARSLVDSGEYDEAEAIAKPIVDQIPESSWANFVVGACMVGKEAYKDAIPYLRTAAQALGDEKVVTEQLALALSGGEQPAPAPEPSKPEATTSPAGPQETTWQNLWAAARLRKLVLGRKEFLAKDEPNLRETLTLAALFVGSLQIAEEVAGGLPQESPYRAYLAAIKARDLAKFRKAMEAWEETDGARELLRENAYGFGLAYLGARGQALGTLSACARKWPHNSVAFYNLAGMYRMAKMPKFMSRVLQRLMMAHPENMEARDQLFKSLYAAGDYEEAQAKAELTYGLFPEDRSSILNLAQVYRTTGQPDAALQVIESGLKALPGDPSLTIAEARTYLYQGQTEAARKVLAAMKPSEPLAGAKAAVEAFAWAEQGDWAKALTSCEAIPEAQRSPSLRMMQAAAFLHQDKKADAVKALSQEQTAKLEDAKILLAALGAPADSLSESDHSLANALAANGPAAAAFARCIACTVEGFYREAFELAKQVDAAAPGMERIPTLELLILARDKSIENREALATAAAEKAPDSPKAWLALAGFWRGLKEDAKEQAALDKVVALDPGNVEALRLRGQLFEKTDQPMKARETYERLLQLLPDDPITCNNLAYNLLAYEGDVNRAAGLAKKALDKLPSSPHVLHTLGLSELRRGNLDEAEKYLGVALQLRPGDPVLLLDFGQILIAKNRIEEGKKHVKLALYYTNQLGLDFDRRAEAEALVKE